MLVDDEPGIRHVLGALIRDFGYDVHTAESAREALEAFTANPFPIVVTDIRMPGMDGLFALLKLIDFAECGAYDRIVVDCAPTGETLALLKFPELFGWYLEKWLPAGKVALRVLSPLSKKLLKLELPDRRAMSDIERLYARLVELQQLLKDPERTSVRIVALPEKMVVEETKRNFLYLNLFGYRVDGLVVNRVLPPEVQGGFFAEWADVQKRCDLHIRTLSAAVRRGAHGARSSPPRY